jgi:hypothetical protein
VRNKHMLEPPTISFRSLICPDRSPLPEPSRIVGHQKPLYLRARDNQHPPSDRGSRAQCGSHHSASVHRVVPHESGDYFVGKHSSRDAVTRPAPSREGGVKRRVCA